MAPARRPGRWSCPTPSATSTCARGSRAWSLDGPQNEPLPQRVERLRAAWAKSRDSLTGQRRPISTPRSWRPRSIARAARACPSIPCSTLLQVLGIELLLQNDNVFDFPTIDLSRSLTTSKSRHASDRLIDVQTRIEHDDRIHELFSEGLCSSSLRSLMICRRRLSRAAPPSRFPSIPSLIRSRSSAAFSWRSSAILSQRRPIRSRHCPSEHTSTHCGRTCSTSLA